MNVSKALMIFSNINSEGFSENEKAFAIWTVMNMPTHDGVTKYRIFEVVRWLWNQLYEIEFDLNN